MGVLREWERLRPDGGGYGRWHDTVDAHRMVRHLPDAGTAYHAGDGARTGDPATRARAWEIPRRSGREGA